MDMSGGGSAMPMGGPGLSDMGMDMSNDTVASDFLQAMLDDTDLQPFDWAITGAFWYGIVVVISLAAVMNFVRWATLKTRYSQNYLNCRSNCWEMLIWLRLRAAAAKHSRPAHASNRFSAAIATVTSIVREASYPQITHMRWRWLRMPPFGTIILILIYLGFVLGLAFFNVDYPGAQYWEARGLRAAWLTVAQFPLLILLSGKNNLIGFLVGISYERLQILHRWVARVILLTATLHGAYQLGGWNEYGVLRIEITTDSCIPTGFATWILLLWLVFSSTAPLRNLSYEFFVIQHVISFAGFLVAVFYHIPSNALNARIFIWLGIGFFLLDRLSRFARSAFNNSKPGRATLVSLPGGVTKVSVHSRRVKSWKPGQHVFLCIPRFGIAQSHPATIASIPSSHNNELVFILRAHKGFTKRILHGAASSSTESLLKKESAELTPHLEERFLAFIDGPYGASHSDFAAFDTTILIAGSTGVTFILPILLDIAHRASTQSLPLRHIVFVWMIKNTEWAVWIVNELQTAVESIRQVGIEVTVHINVTCDPSFTEAAEDVRQCGCDCDVRLGPCCCETGLEEDDEDAIIPAPSGKAVIVDEKAMSSTSTAENPAAVSHEFSVVTRTVSPPIVTRIVSPIALLRSRLAPFSTLTSGRPDLRSLLWAALDNAEGETGVAVCGPAALNQAVRNTVASVSDQRGACKGTGAEGVYLHCEGYEW
ncbi:hypothetical protein MMC11_008940 [Xylographa trunciseda]|nr:hypothetical protein [Xylographa trunciseda]